MPRRRLQQRSRAAQTVAPLRCFARERSHRRRASPGSSWHRRRRRRPPPGCCWSAAMQPQWHCATAAARRRAQDAAQSARGGGGVVPPQRRRQCRAAGSQMLASCLQHTHTATRRDQQRGRTRCAAARRTCLVRRGVQRLAHLQGPAHHGVCSTPTQRRGVISSILHTAAHSGAANLSGCFGVLDLLCAVDRGQSSALLFLQAKK